MDTNKKKGTQDGRERGSRDSKSERKDDSKTFETSQQVSGSGKEEGLADMEHESKSNDDVRVGTEGVESKSREERGEDDSELSGREGPFGEGIPPKPEGDQGYGRHTGRSGAI
jgi:hypothetical protein